MQSGPHAERAFENARQEMSIPRDPQWDLFISHASEDKEDFVAPLAKALATFGVNVWYDEFELKIGDSLSRTIDAGLSKSNYGLVVLSPAFFSKHWPEYELRGLTSKEMLGKKVILPIWHNVKFEEVVKFSPSLADKLAVDSARKSQREIAIKIIETVRPDIFTHIQRRLLAKKMDRAGKIEQIDPKKIIDAPVRHKRLPEDLISRIRLIRAALLSVYPQSMDIWMDGFQRDSHPSREIAVWERIATVLLEILPLSPTKLTGEQYKSVFQFIFALDNAEEAHQDIIAKNLPEGVPEIIRNLYHSQLPTYDIKQDSPFSMESQNDSSEFEKYLDKEDFRYRFPDDMIDDESKDRGC